MMMSVMPRMASMFFTASLQSAFEGRNEERERAPGPGFVEGRTGMVA